MGGMIALMYAGALSRPSIASCRLRRYDSRTLVRLGSQSTNRSPEWVSQLDKIAERTTRSFHSVADAAELISAHNTRLTSEQALHLASHGVRQNADGSYRWKFDQYQSARAPYRLSPNEHALYWSQISLPYAIVAWRRKLSFPIWKRRGFSRFSAQVRLVTVRRGRTLASS